MEGAGSAVRAVSPDKITGTLFPRPKQEVFLDFTYFREYGLKQ
jgi:hypothetical protein